MKREETLPEFFDREINEICERRISSFEESKGQPERDTHRDEANHAIKERPDVRWYPRPRPCFLAVPNDHTQKVSLNSANPKVKQFTRSDHVQLKLTISLVARGRTR